MKLLTKAIGEPIDLEIIDVAAWQPYEQVADQFQCGRVFLVGDCAHTMPPFKAGGANTAIQSAHNLAWKLAAVLDGTADPALLATYHAERYPVGRFDARQSLTGPTVAFIDLDDQGPQLPADEEASMFSLLIGYQYRSAAVVSDHPAPDDPDAVSLVDELGGQPGTRVPHAWVQHGGKRVSTLDLVGHDFTLLTGDDGAPWTEAAASASAVLGIPITVHRIGPAGDARDPDGAWLRAAGLASGGALLVRPDDFVGWRTAALPQSPEHRPPPGAMSDSRPGAMTDPRRHGPPLETVVCLGSSTTASRGTYKWIDELEKRPQNNRFRFVNLGVGGDLSFNTVGVARPSDRLAAGPGDRPYRHERHHGERIPEFPAIRRGYAKRLSEVPSPARFEENLNFIVRKLQRGPIARIGLSSLAPLGEDPNSRHPVQARLNELIATYNGIIRNVASNEHTDYIPFWESFQDQLVRAGTAKPFTHFAFASFYRDYVFREMILRQSFDQISRINGWEFHIDGIHLNSKGGRILAEVVQQFLDS